jgi:thiamine biosynthesis lipoprotein
MGTTAHVLVVAGAAGDARGAAARARARLDDLERRWSRFLGSSEVSMLNAADGAPVVVSPETVELVRRAVTGWERTGGRFDPTVHDAMVALGYDRDLGALDDAPAPAAPPRRAPGCEGVVVDAGVGIVRLPRGVRFDPGGIGKGLAADLVVAELLGDGVDGACVNVGGDLRAEGRAPGGTGWVVGLEDPLTGRHLRTAHLATGAVASTWRTRRVWGPPGSRRHHLVDPATGMPVDSGLAGVAVLAGRAWWAEVLAKAAFLAGPRDGAELLRGHGVAGLLVADDGSVGDAGAIEQFVAA